MLHCVFIGCKWVWTWNFVHSVYQEFKGVVYVWMAQILLFTAKRWHYGVCKKTLVKLSWSSIILHLLTVFLDFEPGCPISFLVLIKHFVSRLAVFFSGQSLLDTGKRPLKKTTGEQIWNFWPEQEQHGWKLGNKVIN